MNPASPTTVSIRAPRIAGDERVLTKEAVEFLSALARTFTARLRELLENRRQLQVKFDTGHRPDFLPQTKGVREGSWSVAPVPSGLNDRRVEITGPVDRKMIINALNSGANVFMADFEDSNSPTWENLISGQIALQEAVRGTLQHQDQLTGKRYALNEKTAALMVRPRGLHLPDAHVEFEGQPMPAALVDFGLFFFHNALVQTAGGAGPWFYLPKLESHQEARFWNDVFLFAQQAVGLPEGTIKATVLIETLPAAFEMDEILYELRQHSAGLNCGRWDYIFSFIKKLRNDAASVLPDRAQVTMEQHFLRSYTQLLVKTCHRRKAHAMGGMAAFIPIRNDAEQNRLALEKVRADKLREVMDGHDGTWVAHPGLVQLAADIFDSHMRGPNQIERQRDDVVVSAEDLLRVPEGLRTEKGLRHNIRVGVQYLEAWLRGLGCVPLYNLMEDAATAEISRTQVWQWIHHRATLEDGEALTHERFRRILREELDGLRDTLGRERFDSGRFGAASELFERLSTGERFEEFLTIPAYSVLLEMTEGQPS
ncbi:malate synthase A [Chondromyces crocatus]|uniref:Malate synthase n=1 Tax=Chondromyces crocatus TaxID=52 RepID=A0A0K1E7Z3_CHOCO|nr:malate synthase A [Chondromyces crocatus]AKT36683.1 malate synthase [Chondromyces crocatus]